MSLSFCYLQTPVGRLKLVASDVGLVAVLWRHDTLRVPLTGPVEAGAHPLLLQTQRQLQEYFAGARTAFCIPLDLRGTAFQLDVWEALQAIPFGRTATYGEIANQLGRPAATRAVGAANGRNPVSIIVPCHRVVGSTGKLTGFAGGLQAKAYLLNLELSGRTQPASPGLFDAAATLLAAERQRASYGTRS